MRVPLPAAAAAGPDWIDVEVFIRALQNASNGVVRLVLSAPADRYSGPLYIDAEHTYPVLTSDTHPRIDVARSQWPNKQHRTLEATAYWLMFDLDARYAPYGEQLPLPLEG